MLGYLSYDCALPQHWFTKMDERLNQLGAPNPHPWSHFVWLYRDKSQSYGGMGVPAPITSYGRDLLKNENDSR